MKHTFKAIALATAMAIATPAAYAEKVIDNPF